MDPQHDDAIAFDEKRTFCAGPVTFAVVHREFTEASMLPYEGQPGVTELLAKIRDEGYYDRGVSIYVNDADSGDDYLRFDCFDVEPHYHYHRVPQADEAGREIEMGFQRIGGYADSVVMNGHWYQVPFDSAANGDMRAWALERLRERLPQMLREVGADQAAEMISSDVTARVVEEMTPVVLARPRNDDEVRAG